VKFTRVILAITVGAVVPLLPMAAHAKTYTSADAPNDVVALTLPGGATTPAPDRAEGDIISSQVQHKARVVILTMQYRELTPGQAALHWYGIKTGTMRRFVLLQADAAHLSGRARLFKGNDKVVRCHIGHTIDYTANTASVRVPASCLGKPRRVKVAMQFGAPNGQGQAWVDDAHNTGGWLPTYGPWVR
jgi:hypothetical protein